MSAIRFVTFVLAALLIRPATLAPSLRTFFCSPKRCSTLYNDGESFYFMDNETYDQVAVPADFIGEKSVWFKENDNAQLLYADTELLC